MTLLRIRAGLSVRDVVRSVPSLSLGTASGWFSGQHVPTRASESTLIEMLELLGADSDLPEWRAAVERVRSRPGPRRRSRRAGTAGSAADPAHVPGQGSTHTTGIGPATTDNGETTSATPSGTAAPGVNARAASDPGVNAGTAPDTGVDAGTAPDAGTDPGSGSTAPAAPPPDDSACPYVGLRPYHLSDAALFHGRSAEITQVLDRVAARRTRPLIVVGASGSGKSSLLAAGVAPRWTEQGSVVTIVRPDGLVGSHATSPGPLVVDQLEEIWSGEVTVDQRRGLLAMLGSRAGAGLPTVLALRADFFQSALTEPVLRDALDDPVVVGPPRRSGLAEIIVEPARSLGFTVEPSLVTLLLDTVAPADVGSETGSDDRSLLPLLSYVLLMCWERSRRRRITVADYYDSGGVEGAVRDAAETVYQGLDPAGRASCRALFLRLVDVSAGRAVRRRAPAGELTDELVVVATSFARVGLLTLDDDAVTPTHEILFSSWPRLVDWITADREALRVWARVRSDAADWEASGRGEAALPTASATADYLKWRDDDDNGPGTHLAESERQFLSAAEAHHESVARTDRRRIHALTALAASLAVVTVLALVASGLALSATSEARQTRDVALSRSGAVSSTSAMTRDPALGRALALAAYRIAPTTEARSALLNTSRADVPLRYEAAPGTGRIEEITGTGWFASVSSDGVLRLFEGGADDAGAALTLGTGDRTEMYSVDLSPDGSALAIAAQSGVHLVDVRDPAAPEHLSTLEPENGSFHSVAFSPDGSTLAAGAGDGTVLRWPLTLRRGLPTVTVRHPVVAVPDPGDEQAKQVEALAWLPDSSTLLVANRTSHVKTLLDAGADGTARRGPELDTGPAAIPLSLTVSQDGRRIAAGTTGRAVHRWALDGRDIAAARPLPELAGWNAYVGDVHYDATGRLAAAGSDERLRVYDPAGTLLVELPASQVATGIHLTSDDHLVSFSVDGLIRNWRLDRLGAASESNSIFQTASSADRTTGVLGVTAAELHHTVVDTTGPVPRETGRVIPDDDTRFSGSVAMSPDGRTVYAGLTDGGIQVFTAPFGQADRSVGSLPVVSGVVVASPLSPDGGTLAVCSDTDPTLALVDVTDPARPAIRASVALPDACVTAEFSADSRQLVVPTLGPETLIVDTSDPDRPTVAHRLTTGIGASPSAGYAHDASLLATSGGDQTIRLWDVNDPVAPTELASFPAPGGEIYWTAFSADDQLLLITSSTGQVTVVDVSEPGEPVPWAVLGATTDPLLYQGRSASPDGGLLAVGVEGAMVMWQLDPEIVMDEACTGGVQLTDEEWGHHFPDTEPFALCD